MFEIHRMADGTVVLSGRLDTAHAEDLQKVMVEVSGRCDIDMQGLGYINSMGLGVLMHTQKRLLAAGGGLRLTNVNRHLREMFHYAGFDTIFEILPPAGE